MLEIPYHYLVHLAVVFSSRFFSSSFRTRRRTIVYPFADGESTSLLLRSLRAASRCPSFSLTASKFLLCGIQAPLFSSLLFFLLLFFFFFLSFFLCRATHGNVPSIRTIYHLVKRTSVGPINSAAGLEGAFKRALNRHGFFSTVEKTVYGSCNIHRVPGDISKGYRRQIFAQRSVKGARGRRFAIRGSRPVTGVERAKS